MTQSSAADAATEAPAHLTPAGRTLPVTLLVAMRPRQWVKNVLVFAAPVTAGVLTKGGPALRTVETFAIFIAASASTYVLNDVVDAPADRLHPQKRHRPVASGALSKRAAVTAAVLLLLGALAGAALISPELLAVVGVYLALAYGYNFWLKRIAVVEMGVVSAGFVLRASAGAAASHLAVSPWFLIVTSAGALFIVAGKRGTELSVMGDAHSDHRAVLGSYPPIFLLVCRVLAASVAVTSYCLWVFERAQHLSPGRHVHSLVWFELSIVPFVLTFLVLELAIESGRAGAPEELALSDRGLQLLAIAWIALIALGIYL